MKRQYSTYLVIGIVLISIVLVSISSTWRVGHKGEIVDSKTDERYMKASSFFESNENDSQDFSREDSWEVYDSIFILRNDDVRNISNPEVKYINSIARDKKIPVTHSIVPLSVKDQEKTCEDFRKIKNKSNLIDYAMHGYSHSNLVKEPYPSEFYSLDYQNQSKRIRKGIEIYQNCLGARPRVLVPPQNTYDNITVKVLKENDFYAVSGFDRMIKERENMPKLKSSFHELITAQSALNFDLKRMKTAFNKSYKREDVFVQMIHHWALKNSTQKKKLEEYLEYVESKNVKFMSLNQFSVKARQEKILYRDSWIVKDR